MSSNQKNDLFLEEVETAPEIPPVMNTEPKTTKPSLSRLSFTETNPFMSVSDIQTWDMKCTSAWSSLSSIEDNQATEAWAWKIQDSKTPVKTEPKTISLSQKNVGSVLKHETPAQKEQVTKKKQNEDLTRPLWSNKVEYMLAQVGYSMKLTNLWIFPQLWFLNGGIFIIIYTFILFSVGFPLLFMEMAFGQKLRQGSLAVWKLTSPWMTGLGYTIFMVCFICGLSSNMINCWSLFYFGQSLQFPLPWDKCPLVKNSSEFDAECARTTPSMYFWYRVALKASDSIDDFGTVTPNLILTLFLAWCLIAVTVINGLKSVGKVMYVLVPLPYFIILCFCIRCLLLEGALAGFRYLLIIKMPTVYSLKTWSLAGNLVLSTLGLGLGVITSFSSYMPSSNNCLMDAFIITLVSLGTSLFVTPVIIATMGFWVSVTTVRCREKNVEILMSLISQGELPPEARPPNDVLANMASMFTFWIESLPHPIKELVLSKVSDCSIKKQLLKIRAGTNFAFLAFSEALSFIPGTSYWSFFFFLMLLAVGLSTIIGIVQGIITPLQDTFFFFRRYPNLLLVTLSVILFLGSLFFTNSSGYYYFRLMNDYWKVLPILFIVTLETVAIAWVYGIKRFSAEMVILSGRPLTRVCWSLLYYLCPFVMLILSVITVIYIGSHDFDYIGWDSRTSKEVVRKYPLWAVHLMLIVGIFVFLPNLICFVICLIRKILVSCITFQMPTRVSKPLLTRNRVMFHKGLRKEGALQYGKKPSHLPVM